MFNFNVYGTSDNKFFVDIDCITSILATQNLYCSHGSNYMIFTASYRMGKYDARDALKVFRDILKEYGVEKIDIKNNGDKLVNLDEVISALKKYFSTKNVPLDENDLNIEDLLFLLERKRSRFQNKVHNFHEKTKNKFENLLIIFVI